MINALKSIGYRLVQILCYLLHFCVNPRGAIRRARQGPPYLWKHWDP